MVEQRAEPRALAVSSDLGGRPKFCPNQGGTELRSSRPVRPAGWVLCLGHPSTWSHRIFRDPSARLAEAAPARAPAIWAGWLSGEIGHGANLIDGAQSDDDIAGRGAVSTGPAAIERFLSPQTSVGHDRRRCWETRGANEPA